MAEYQLKISGVHYGANGDSVAGQKDTEEMHVRTREMLSWIDREHPIVVLSADLTNHIHKEAIMARAQGKRIGRVAFEDVNLAWALLRQSEKPMMLYEMDTHESQCMVSNMLAQEEERQTRTTMPQEQKLSFEATEDAPF